MHKKVKIKELFSSPEKFLGKEVKVAGWVKTIRNQKQFAFIEINDGSSLQNLQIIYDEKTPDFASIEMLTTGSSVSFLGIVVESPKKGQKVELQANSVHIYGLSDTQNYPLQKKRHSFEFLRSIAHLRVRTNTQGAVIRVRNALAFATHLFFQQKGFFYIQTPIITSSDCEGGGELFQVTTLDLEDLPYTKAGDIDYQRDFFGKPAYLTVSGQLNAEIFACGMSDVYTFGPTFRAENSHTSRHLAEFWMIEPEMAFADLEDDKENAQQYLQFLSRYVLENCKEDIEFFDRFIEKGLIDRLQNVVEHPFAQLSYTEAIAILEKAPTNFTFPIEWGVDLQSEHERYLAETHCKKPLIIYNYPASIKAFYMRENDDEKTVAAMDIIAPKVGEIVGGSQREERLDILEKKLTALNLPKEHYWWYLQLREYGTVPHAGYGVGFERLIQFITGMENIRDVIAIPRYPGHIDF